VIQIYAAQGFKRFILLTGHRSALIDAFAVAESWPADVTVETHFTGEDTPTGGRVQKACELLSGETFLVTYADGVADIDLRKELAFHHEHGDLATMAVVRPELQFGVTQLNGDGRVNGFQEKPISDHWINGGFFCFEPGVFSYLDPGTVLEREPLEGLAADGQLHAFRHTGFWECMDTYKDTLNLNDLWESGAPWKVWT
jgi:glucose-1-phosphate cytidylyltransferase